MKKFFLILSIFLTSINGFGQFEDIFASGGDADKFLTRYMQPVFDGIMSANNSGWTTSAEPLKPFRLELTVSAAAAFVPVSSETFVFNDNDYNYLRLESGDSILPTVMGEDTDSRIKIVIPINNNEYKVMEFDAPGGIKNELPINAVPAPLLQLSMGLPLSSEVNLRYLPQLTSEDGGYVKLLGIGIKHSLSQYFPTPKDEDGNKQKRNFNLALHAAYQNLQAGYDNPDDDKAVNLHINTLSFKGLASFDYKFLSLYSSLGYTSGFSSLDVLGPYHYTYAIQDSNGNTLGSQDETVTDPLQLDFDSSGVSAGIGVKLKLWILSIYADYTFQKFPVAHAGIGLKI